jgi:hypothetical protein
MNFFSQQETKAFNELEKQVMSSGKVILELNETIDYICAVSCPRRHVRANIALSIIAMQRIAYVLAQHGEQVECINELPSALYVSDLFAQEYPCMATHIRRLFLADLVKMRRLFQDVLDESVKSPKITVLRSLLKPEVPIFGNDGNIKATLYACFVGAGARTVGVEANRETEEYECVVSATDTEDQFFAKLAVQLGLTKCPHVRFIRHKEGNLVQEGGTNKQNC